MPLKAGTRLGIYEVTAKIGEGGMGEVYQARDTTLDRDVALKVLPEAFTADPDRLARFQREAKVLASLNHPNIGAIYGLEAAGDTQALVLELIEGPTLADRIAEGPIPVDEALTIATQIAEAIEAAHEQGIVHRDLKPANVKVRPDGTVKVLDFGLAKAATPEASGTSGSESPTMSLTAATQMGMVIGTAAYMAPEQARGKPVDQRADVWAFAVVLFEMLSGPRVFHGDDVSLTLAKVLEGQPKWDALPSSVPPRVTNLLRRCLEKNPKQRMHAVGDVRLAMTGAFEIASSSPSAPTVLPTLRIWQRPVAVVVAVMAALALGALAARSLTRPAPLRVARFPIPLASDQNFSFTGRHVVALSPDGSQVVYAANRSLWLRPVEQLQAIQVSGTETEARGPFFSADGQSIGFWAAGQLKKVSVSGGAPVVLADVPVNPSGASWGADDMVLYGQPEGIMQVPGASGTPELLIPVAEGEFNYGPQMLPGGEWVLFTLRTAGSWDEGEIVAQSVTTNERRVLVSGGRDGRYVASGHLVYGLNGVIFAVPFDVSSLQVTGGPVPLVEGVRQAPANTQGASQFSVSTNGSLAYVPGSGAGVQRTLVWVDREGREEPINVPPRAYTYARLAPDGTRVALDSRDEENDIWIWDLSRETLQRLTFDPGLNRLPLWTPDSQRVAFTAQRDGTENIYWQAADGSGSAEPLSEGETLRGPKSFTPDTTRLVFTQPLAPPYDIGVITIDGDRQVEMLLETSFSETNGELSPDGEWLAYESTESGQSEIYLRPFPDVQTSRQQVSTGGGSRPLWSRDGRELFYYVEPGTIMAVPIGSGTELALGRPEVIIQGSYATPLNTGRHYDVSPDGQRFLLLRDAGDTSEDVASPQIILVQNWFEELKDRVPVP